MRARLAPEPECARAGSVSLSSGDLAGLMDVDGFGQLPGAPGQQRPHSGGADYGSPSAPGCTTRLTTASPSSSTTPAPRPASSPARRSAPDRPRPRRCWPQPGSAPPWCRPASSRRTSTARCCGPTRRSAVRLHPDPSRSAHHGLHRGADPHETCHAAACARAATPVTGAMRPARPVRADRRRVRCPASQPATRLHPVWPRA
jgi:hypothetical protein